MHVMGWYYLRKVLLEADLDCTLPAQHQLSDDAVLWYLKKNDIPNAYRVLKFNA